MMATEPVPCSATDSGRVCCYAEGHEDRGFNHRFVTPDPTPTPGEIIAEIISANGFVKFDALATEDMDERMRRLWRETGKIDTGEDDPA